jgi:outer membrane protein assembly factor BamB
MCRFRRIITATTLALCLATIPVGLGTTAKAGLAATTFSNWSAYLSGPRHSSVNKAATAITPAKVAGLTRIWRWMPAAPTMTGQPGPALFASPTVVNGRVYIGANTGVFYALDEATGHVVWQRFLGFVTRKTCSARGFTSTATVVPDPVSGALTVYVAAADGYLYALNAGTGATRWRSVVGIPSTTVNDYYNWSSPTIANGKVYVGVSSECDNPLVRGGLKEYNQATGAQLAYYRTYPCCAKGPSIWSSAAASPGGTAVFVTTGNGPSGSDAVSIVRLDAATLAKQARWQVPSGEHGSDSDFGGSPTLFTATLSGTAVPMVGACNKNGVYYALQQNNFAAGPLWRFKAGAPETAGGQCDAAAIADGANLFVAGNTTTIGGVTYKGSISLLNPSTGGVRWRRGLGGPVIGSPSLDGGGVLAVPTYSSNGVFIVQASNGAILRNVATGPEFGQPVFADNLLLLPTQKNGLWAYRPAS